MKLSGPKPLNAVSQLSAVSRLWRNAAMLGLRGATMPQPKIPTLRTAPALHRVGIVPQLSLGRGGKVEGSRGRGEDRLIGSGATGPLRIIPADASSPSPRPPDARA